MYLLHPSSCGYYCLKNVVKNRRIKRKSYMSLFYQTGRVEFFNLYKYAEKNQTPILLDDRTAEEELSLQ